MGGRPALYPEDESGGRPLTEKARDQIQRDRQLPPADLPTYEIAYVFLLSKKQKNGKIIPMPSQHLVISSTRFLLLDIIGDVLVFPVWWYTKGLADVAMRMSQAFLDFWMS